jgi:NAD(P)-dependent dehydrogenase (short-subunit alcohol dehydrogenase family)
VAARPLPVLVSGGASGLGAAIAAELRKEGETVVVFDQRPLDDPDAVRVDLADTAAAEARVHEVAARWGGLSALVTAAGTDACGALDEVPREAWERVVAVNLLGTAALVRGALPHLARSGGRVVTVASTLGLRALSHASAYCASKFGVVGFTRALAVELAGRVGVTLLIPGGMQTAFFDGRDPRFQPPPDAPLLDPRDVARAVAFALRQPHGCEIRELVITPSREGSWP